MWSIISFFSITSKYNNRYSYYKYYATPTITSTLEEGDRLRIYYKGDNSDEWQWARSTDLATVNDDVLVKASPEDMAEGFYFAYNKDENKLYIGNKHAMKLNVYNDETNDWVGGGEFTFNFTGVLEDLPSGTYRIETSLGSNPYVLTVKL